MQYHFKTFLSIGRTYNIERCHYCIEAEAIKHQRLEHV